MHTRTALAVVLVLGVALIGCGAKTTSSPCRGDGSALDEPPSHHDPELEARIPDTVGDASLDLQSVCAGKAEIGGINMTPEFLEQVGIEADDVSMAVTNPAIGGAFDGSLTAVRYFGASEDAIRCRHAGGHASCRRGRRRRTARREGRRCGARPLHERHGRVRG